jgi:hypothetical protein
MDFKAIERITNQVKDIKESIARVNKTIEILNNPDGKVADIKIQYLGEPCGTFGIYEEGELVTRSLSLDPKYCGVNEEFFNNIFKEVTIKQLEVLRNNLNVQIMNLEKEMKKLV